MNTSIIDQYYRPFLAVALVLTMFSNALHYGLMGYVLPIPDNGWVLVFAVLASPLFFMSDEALTGSVLLIAWAYCYLLLILVTEALQMVGGGRTVATADLAQAVLFVMLLLTTLVVCGERRACRAALWSTAAVSLFSVAMNIYEFTHPSSFSKINGRAAGLYMDPNISGSVLVVGMVLGSLAVPPRFRLLFQLTIGVGVLTTVSRGGLIEWLIAFFLLQASRINREKVMHAWGILLVTVVVLHVSPAWSAVEARITSQSTQRGSLFQRLQLVDSEALASDSRFSLAIDAWHMYLDHPVLGYGNAVPIFGEGLHPQGPHNMFLLMLIQHGVVGGIVLGALIWVLYVLERRSSLLIPFTFSGLLFIQALFTHTMFMQYPYAVGVSLAVVTLVLHPSQAAEKRRAEAALPFGYALPVMGTSK
jgi:hypothetical protein